MSSVFEAASHAPGSAPMAHEKVEISVGVGIGIAIGGRIRMPQPIPKATPIPIPTPTYHRFRSIFEAVLHAPGGAPMAHEE